MRILSPGFATVCLALADELRIGLLQKVVGGLAGLDVGAMVDEFADGDLRGELGQAAEVIAVPVRDDQMIDLGEAGVMDGIHDAAGIANGAGRDVARIHEQRLAGGRDEERGVAAFDVDDVDVESRAGFAGFPLRMRE